VALVSAGAAVAATAFHAALFIVCEQQGLLKEFTAGILK